MSEQSERYTCNYCNKFYSSKSSLCNHNKKFHKYINNTHNTLHNILHNTLHNTHNTLHKTLNNLYFFFF